ncbi:MAG: hypothetical protein BM485_06640 [Desulfobulbaceae bacterium DB1]|nr:MAG: hypothetical protein BM485_06640 [Desulfobulbaceae bacterium DB1]
MEHLWEDFQFRGREDEKINQGALIERKYGFSGCLKNLKYEPAGQRRKPSRHNLLRRKKGR